uniref:hypothetical protein n=1 Tax=Faecalibacillus intestinalis TaxID=1982626 RepID=UPI002FDB0F84
IIIFISIGIWCLEIYHFNKLYQDARDSIHGYWVEEIIFLKQLVTIIIFISIGIWCLEIYHFNKLYQDARDSIHGYWVEEITEDSRTENE